MTLDGYRGAVAEHQKVVADVEANLLPAIDLLATEICAALAGGGKVVVFGNGGSAADAQHFATELIGRFSSVRGPLAAIALTTDSSALTAIGNDFGFDEVFARQVEGLVLPQDLVVAISASGQSQNVVRGLEAARQRGAVTAALCGQGGRLAEIADRVVAVPSQTTSRIQEAHALIIHLVCEMVDSWVRSRDTASRSR